MRAWRSQERRDAQRACHDAVFLHRHVHHQRWSTRWPPTHPKFRAAASRPAGVPGISDASIDKAIGLIAEAAKNGAS